MQQPCDTRDEFLSDEAKELLHRLVAEKKVRIMTMKPIAHELEWRGYIRISRGVAHIRPAGEFAARNLSSA